MNFFRVKIDFFETRLNLFLQMIKKGFLSGVECKVLITSVPKSGTHLVTKLFTDFFNYEKFGDGVNRMYCFNTEGCFNEIRRRISWLPRMSFITGHIFFDSELNKSILEKKIKVLLMIRDPRDVVLSTANYVMEKEHSYSPYFSKLSLSESINRIITGIDGPIQSYQPKNPKIPSVESFHHDMQGGIFETYKRFTRWEQTENILIVKFEDLVGSKGGGDDEKQEEAILKILEFCSIKLKNVDIGNIKNNLFGASSTFRKGQIGSWKKAFTENNKLIFKSRAGDLLIDLDYEEDNNW